MEYLAWRLDDPKTFYGYKMATGDCELCLKLTKPSGEKKKKKFANGRKNLPMSKIVTSLDGWIYNEEDKECLL